MDTPLSAAEFRCYAIDRLGKAKRQIAQSAAELPAARAKLEKYIAKNKAKAEEHFKILLSHKENLLGALNDCRRSLLEMELPMEAAAAMKLCAALAAFTVTTPDYSKLCGILTAFLERLPDERDGTTSAAIIGRLMSNVRMGYYPTDLDHIKMMARGVAFPDGVTTNLLDPCCGEGIALRAIATGNNCMTYGVEIDESRAAEAQERLHRVAFGSYFYSRISHDAFHVMLLNPPYLSVMNENGGKARHEKRFLAESYEHLMPGGLLVYIIPYYRLTPDIARILCDNFTDLSVYRFMGAEFERFHQVAVLGIRKKREDGSSLVAPFMEAVSDHTKLPELSELPEKRYQLPAKPMEVALFKGAVFNVAELARQLAASKSLSKRLEKSALDSTAKHPILPLNVSQVGLIGGSGMINGLAMCDNPHIIKGRIVKEITAEEEVTRTDAHGKALVTERTEITSNKLIFNILTSNGFKSLTQ